MIHFDIWSSEPACPPTMPKGALWSFACPIVHQRNKEQIVGAILLADRAPAQTPAALLLHGLAGLAGLAGWLDWEGGCFKHSNFQTFLIDVWHQARPTRVG